MEIELININDIKPYINNPRTNTTAIKRVRESIEEFGFKVPIVLDREHNIITGHTRFEASKELGFKEVPCIIAHDLDDLQTKRFRLVDNKTSEFAKWDIEKLNEELKEVGNMVNFGLILKEFKEKTEVINERERTFDAYKMNEITAGFNRYGIPSLKIDEIGEVHTGIGFNYLKTHTATKGEVLHFYIDDYQFERIWAKTSQYVEYMRDYEAVITPDFSLYADMPLAVQIWNVYRSRAIGQILQSNGIKVIPHLTWGSPKSLEFSCDGIKQGGTVSVSSVGCAEVEDEFKDNLRKALAITKPKKVIMYGNDFGYDWGNIEVVKIKNGRLTKGE